MAFSVASLARLQQKALRADQLIAVLKAQIESVQQTAVANACKAEQERLTAENNALRQEVELMKQRLIQAETLNGVIQVPLPSAKSSVQSAAAPASVAASPSKQAPLTAAPAEKVVPETNKAAKGGKKADAKPDDADPTKAAKASGGVGATAKPPSAANVATPAVPSGGGERVDVSRLDMRVGLIRAIKRHPDADSLYVEEVDVGEDKPRTICSGLVGRVAIEQLQNRLAIFMLNLKPAKMRGIASEGMIMCAGVGDRFEVLELPPGVAIGDRIVVDGFPGKPDEQLNPKKKIWEQVKPDLRVDVKGLATFRGVPWRVEGREGFVRAPTLTDAQIS